MAIARRFRIAICLGVAIVLGGPSQSGAGDLGLEKLATCIANSGAVFYGAHWCPYCRKQMEAFEAYADLLPYVECYDEGKRKGMRAECTENGVKSFPTWHYPDGTIVTGARSPETLARATGCL